jgi:hypothetical protein
MTDQPPKPEDRPASPRFKKRASGSGRQARPGAPPPHLHPTIHVSLQTQRLVGRAIIAFAKLEGTVQDAIWRFLKVDEEDGRIVTSNNDVDANITILEALGKRHLTEDVFIHLRKILKHAKQCQGHRNFIAHGMWGTFTPDPIPFAMSIRKKSDPGTVYTELFPPLRLYRIANLTNATILALFDLMDAYCTLHGLPVPKPPPDARNLNIGL